MLPWGAAWPGPSLVSLPGGVHSGPAGQRDSLKLEQTWLVFFFKRSPKQQMSLALICSGLGEAAIIALNDLFL